MDDKKRKVVNPNAINALLSSIPKPQGKANETVEPTTPSTNAGNGLAVKLNAESNGSTIEKTYKSPEGNEVTKKNIRKVVPVSKTALHPKNPRIRGKLDPVFLASIQEGGVEEHIITVRYKGDDTLYVIDGGTRREGCLQSDIADIPTEIIEINKDEEWIVDWIISAKNNRRPFSAIENMVRVDGILKDCDIISFRGLSALIQRQIQVKVSNSTLPIYICSVLVFDLTKNLPQFFKFDNTNKLSTSIIADVIQFVTGQTIPEIISSIPRADTEVGNTSQKSSGYDFNNPPLLRTDEVLSMISLVNEEFQKLLNETTIDKIDDVVRLKALKKIVTKKKEAPIKALKTSQTTQDNLEEFINGDSPELDITMNLNRSDYDATQISELKKILIKFNALELFKQIYKITEG